MPAFPRLKLATSTSPGNQSGQTGGGNLYLTNSEDAELNKHLPAARDQRMRASTLNTIATVLTFIPDFNIKLAPIGIGIDSEIFGGAKLSDALKIGAEIISTDATWEQDQAGIASRTASYERRAEEWILQARLAAQELMQIGKQVIGSLIAEQIAHREYLNIQKQIEHTQEVDRFLHEKFTNEELYAWMQGETARLYYEYYRFAVDTARKAEQTMKRELMRPEVDATDYIKFNYWDTGRRGLLSGEALYLDLKRMEMAYYDNNRRELELTRHVSLRQLNPVALLKLKATGSCEVTVPEWLYDMDCPGHYMRRIKTVALSIPSIVGPYTSVNCTLSLIRSRLRKSSIAGDDYAWQGPEDSRFANYTGMIQSVVTSSAQNDSGLFEMNLREERFLPFEGAGAESTWKLELPQDYRAFDYSTIADVILHIRYTARQGVEPSKVTEYLNALFAEANSSNLALLFSLRHDFPTEWAVFKNGSDFSVKIRKDHFPYFTQKKTITRIKLNFFQGTTNINVNPTPNPVPDLTNAVREFSLTAGKDLRSIADTDVSLVVGYSLI